MSKQVLVVILATLVLSVVALADPPADAYQLRYAANLDKGDSVVNLTNAGTLGGTELNGTICAQVYVFNQDQTLAACCSCPLTPNHLKSLSVKNDLINNPLTVYTTTQETSVTIGLLATKQLCVAGSAATVAVGDLVGGLRAWGTTIHALPVAGTYGVTESAFSNATLSASELQNINYRCAGTLSNGSGYGICNACKLGALGAARQ